MIDAFLITLGIVGGGGLSLVVFLWLFHFSLVLTGYGKRKNDPALEELKVRNELTRETNALLDRIAKRLEVK